jgi:hypothetical protein
MGITPAAAASPGDAAGAGPDRRTRFASRPRAAVRQGAGRASVGAWRAGAAGRAQRKPRLLLRFVGAFLLRFAARTFEGASLFQLPPRLTRAACPGDA